MTLSEMNEKQEAAVRELSQRYDVGFEPEWFRPVFDLPSGWVAGWIGGPAERLYVGVSPEGQISS